MSLVLHVDGDRWRAHLREVAAQCPGLVPVAKGNGYGFGNGRLARRAGWLGCDTLAVGTYAEIDDVAQRFAGDLVVLTPWREADAAHLTADQDDPAAWRVGLHSPQCVSRAGVQTEAAVHAVVDHVLLGRPAQVKRGHD